MNESFEKRQLGDYDVDAIISNNEALKIFENANFFVGKIKTYPGPYLIEKSTIIFSFS